MVVVVVIQEIQVEMGKVWKGVDGEWMGMKVIVLKKVGSEG